ncbi:MAG TPA: hypothetical protein VEA41_06145 [Salinarimonas sp.]|nr:hypothetical protein [Salinarimonas sp.]
MTSKHPKTQPKDRPRDDLVDDPGIGRSKGSFATGEDPRTLDGASTFEGDTENQVDDRTGAVNPDRVPRHNK